MKTNSKAQFDSIKTGINHIRVLVGIVILIAGLMTFSGHSRSSAASAAKIITYPVPAEAQLRQISGTR